MKSTRIAIIGRPNVGKSTLFNRLIGKKRALVHDLPGVTRDRLIEDSSWWIQGKAFAVSLIDTGGLGGEHFAEEIEAQVDCALQEADVVIILLDGQVGLIPADRELMRKVRQKGLEKRVPLIAVVNKLDADVHESRMIDFYSLGIEPLLSVSAEHGRGVEDLRLAIAEAVGFPDKESLEEIPASADDEEAGKKKGKKGKTFAPKGPPVLAVVGKPNVGKSTFVNMLLGEKRMITSPIPGTTTDSVDLQILLNERPFTLIDTAGVRRKGKTEQGVEVLSVVQTKKAIERADIAILVMDGEEGIADQDEKIGGMIEEAGCSVILMMNKWDTQRQNKEFSKEDASERIRKKIAFLRYAPLMFVSAKNGFGFDGLGDLIEEIMRQRQVQVSTKEFSYFIRTESTIHNPDSAKFYLCHQAGRNPPTFVCHVNDPKKIRFSLQRHLVNAIRERWGYMGSPVRLLFRKGGSLKSQSS